MSAATRQHLAPGRSAMASGLAALWLLGSVPLTPVAAAPAGPATTSSATASPLPAAGESITRPLTGGETHAYTVELAAGDFLRVVADQHGIDLEERLYDPAGQQVLAGDGPNGREGAEPVSWVAEDSGAYRLEIAASSARAPAGVYELRVEALRPAVAGDRLRVTAERTQYEGLMAAFTAATPEAREAGRETLERALVQWQAVGSLREQAEVLDLLDNLSRRAQQPRPAAAYAARAAELWQQLGEPARELRAQNNAGLSLTNLGDFTSAEPPLRRALVLAGELGDRRGEALARSNLGHLLQRRGELTTARAELTAALALLEVTPDPSTQVRALNNLGLLDTEAGDVESAISRYRQASAIAHVQHDGEMETALANNLGFAMESQGRLQEALERYREAQESAAARGDRTGESFAVHNLGTLYLTLGRPSEAIPFYERARALQHAVGDRAAEAFTLHNLAWCQLRLDRPEAARPLAEEAVAAARELAAAPLLVSALALVAEVDLAQDRLEDAAAHAGEAVRAAAATGRTPLEAMALARRGKVETRRGHDDDARRDLQRSLALSVADRRPLGQAQALSELARVERGAGRLGAARQALEGALDQLENLRAAVAVEELRISFFADRREVYERYVDVLMALHAAEPDAGWDGRALGASERSRSRSLLDLLAEARVDLDRGIDPVLVEREQTLGRQLNTLERRRLVLAAGGDAAQAASLEGEIRDTNRRLEWARAEVRRASPQRAALLEPEPIDALAIEQSVVTAGTTLLEYSLGEERSFLWVVHPEGLASFTLPGRAAIEELARRFHEELEGDGADSGALAATGRRLSQLVLAPAAGLLGSERLVIVADGALHYVPFAALPEPGDPPDGGVAQPLLVRHEVVNLPSASVLPLLRRPRQGPVADRQIALFADPVFDPLDPRVHPEAPALDPATSRGDAVSLDFRRLRFSRQEAERIGELVSPEERLEAFDFAAARDTAMSPDLARYHYVHFATHAVVHAEIPALSGLVLSLVDEAGHPEDGFLRLHDLYNLHLGADLVTLSACRTALGREFSGEGLVSLTRGFMYSGAARVVASLWEVDDRATAEVMTRFYRGILDEGLAPAAALRAAQLSLWREPRWSAPRYWAAFVLEGRWD